MGKMSETPPCSWARVGAMWREFRFSIACWVALSAAILVLAACRSLPPPSDPRAIWCANNEPRTDYYHAMPRVQVDKINAHNAKGEQWCEWRP